RLHLGIGEGGIDLFVELADDLGRRGLWCADAKPDARLVARHELSHRRDVRQRVRARRSGDCESAQLASPDVLNRSDSGGEVDLRLACEEISKCRPRAAIGQVNHVDAGHHLEKLAGGVAVSSGARRRHGELAGIGLGIGDELGNRLGRNRRVHHHDEAASDDARDRRDVADEIEVFSFWTTSFVAFNGDSLRELASQFLALAEKQMATVPLMIGHRMMGSVLHTGAFAEGRSHLDRAIALYNPPEHRLLTTRFGQDIRVAALSYRSWALWMLGYPDAALLDTSRALEEAREIGQAATLMYALVHALLIHIQCGNYAAANAEADELITLANKKGALFWKAQGMAKQGCILAVTGKAAEAVQMITSGIAAWRSTGSTAWMPLYLSYLARAYAEFGQFEHAWRCIEEAMTAMETTKERWHE